MNLSIIIPAYNEEQSIAKVINSIKKRLRHYEHSYEIIIVDDGSTDETFEQALAQKVRVIQHSRNRGYGAALKTGIQESKHDWIVLTDADGTYPAARMLSLLEFIPEHDMVVGARTKKQVYIPFFRKAPKWILTRLAGFLAGEEIPDLNSGLRVIKKDVVKTFLYILPDGFSFTSTITLALATNRYRIKYVPIEYFRRKGKSKIRPIRDTLSFIQLIIRTVLYFNPLRVFIPMFAILFTSGFLLLLCRVFITRAFAVTSIILLLSSFQILAIGMLADLIDKRVSK